MQTDHLAARSPGVITTHGETLVVIATCLLVASTVVVGLRVYTRATRTQKIDLSDWLMVVAWLLEAIHVAFIAVAFTYGLGKHFDDLSPYNQKMTLFYAVGLIELFAVTPCMFGRLSFAVFLLALLAPTMRWKRWILWSVITIQAIINAIIIQIYAQCGSKPAALWDPVVKKNATCQSPSVEANIGYVQSALNLWADITLTAVPAFLLWGLQMPRRQKAMLACVLMLSIFAFAASIVKAIEIRNLAKTGDFSWFMTDLQTWVCVENNVVMMTASTPALKPFFTRKEQADSSLNPYYNNSFKLRGSGRSGTVGSAGWSKSRNERKRLSEIAMSYGDTQSEEHILSTEQEISQIRKTTEVQIS